MSLLPISRRIAAGALRLSGNKIVWYKAMFCPGKRPSGAPCYDEEQGSSYIECPICKSAGAIYAPGKVIWGTYSDNSNSYSPDGSGGFLAGDKTLALPYNLEIHILKERHGEGDFGRRFLRDKFIILNPQGKAAEVLYLKDDPTKPTIGSDTIYQIVKVTNNF